jgi:hypothetical protein
VSGEDKYTGKRISDKDARLINQELEVIEKTKGRLTTTETAEELVRRSRPASSPTHHLFTWDDKEAADERRLDQARSLIRAVYVVFAELPDQKPVRARVNVEYGGKRGPVTMRRVLQSADLTQQLLEKAQVDLEIWSARYESLRKLAELRHVFEAIDRVSKRVAKKRSTKPAQQSARV